MFLKIIFETNNVRPVVISMDDVSGLFSITSVD